MISQRVLTPPQVSCDNLTRERSSNKTSPNHSIPEVLKGCVRGVGSWEDGKERQIGTTRHVARTIVRGGRIIIQILQSNVY